MNRFLLAAGTAIMLIGVAAGAFGAHGLSGYFERFPRYEGTFDTAVRYQLIHGLAILLTALLTAHLPGSLTQWAGNLFIIGTLIFSGSLYLLVLTQKGWLGAITPLGGVAFLAGWALLFIAALRQ